MENSGIMNIISALKKLTSSQDEVSPSDNLTSPTQENQKQTQKVIPEDYTFVQPLKYNYLYSIIERHDIISKRIDKNNKK